MKSYQLKPLPKQVQRVIPTTQVCKSCRAFKAECEVPYDEGTWPMCWLCAHQIVDHGVSLYEATEAQCECLPEAMYPASVIASRKANAYRA